MAKRIPHDGDYKTTDIGTVTLEYVTALLGVPQVVRLDTGAAVLWKTFAHEYNKRATTLVSLAADGKDEEGVRSVYGDALWLSALEFQDFQNPSDS